ncbi:MAG: IS66 family transposase zinc-finger binding domain-containing protein, partial [Nitrosomonas sp.]|nr:IS66 family transposase zinc-finger binding domain-containing protein [Nitrosomonas sp.]
MHALGANLCRITCHASEHRHEPQSRQCRQCGSDLIKIGEDVTEQLDVKPAEFFVHCHIRPAIRLPYLRNRGRGTVPPAVINGGMATPDCLL